LKPIAAKHAGIAAIALFFLDISSFYSENPFFPEFFQHLCALPCPDSQDINPHPIIITKTKTRNHGLFNKMHMIPDSFEKCP